MAEIRIVYEKQYMAKPTNRTKDERNRVYYRFLWSDTGDFEFFNPKNRFFLDALDTYRLKVSRIFLLKGKKEYNNEIFCEVSGSELDIDYFKMVDILSAKRYSVWRTALKMFSDGKSKEEVLDYLKTEAVAEVLSK